MRKASGKKSWGGAGPRGLATRAGAGLLAAALLAACGSDSPSPAEAVARADRHPLYFDMKGLLERQIQQLTARRAAVAKQVSLRSGTPETAIVPAVKWADELQLFFQADINKAALRGAYAVDSAAYPPGSGQRRRYSRRAGHDNAPVESLLVLSEGGQPTEIQASITQENALFSTHKQLRMKLVNGRLTEYGVTGTQKLVLFDTLRYATRATVR